jgi:hypothetical protein
MFALAACGGEDAPAASSGSPSVSPSPTVNSPVLAHCRLISPLLDDMGATFQELAAGTLTIEESVPRFESAQNRMDAFADSFAQPELAVNAHGVADRIGVMLVSLRRGEEPGESVDALTAAGNGFVAACRRVAGA